MGVEGRLSSEGDTEGEVGILEEGVVGEGMVSAEIDIKLMDCNEDTTGTSGLVLGFFSSALRKAEPKWQRGKIADNWPHANNLSYLKGSPQALW